MAEPTVEVTRIRCVDLAEDVTLDLFLSPQRRAYRFLSKRGEFLRETARAGGVGDPVTVDDWQEALTIAQSNEAPYIVCYEKRRVLHGVAGPRGGMSWYPAVTFPHDAIRRLDGATERAHESTERTKRSGAERRKWHKTQQESRS